MKNNRKIWITWHYSARSRNLASYLNLPIFEEMIVKNTLIRHLVSSIWTVKILIVQRPTIIFIQLSFLLLLFCAIYKIIRFNKVVIVADCHTKALRRKAKGPLNKIFWPLKKFCFKTVNLSIISNTGMEKDIKILHCNYIILPDKIPEIVYKKQSNKKKKYCVYISSFAVDEPFEEIFEVAEILNPEINIFWTGKQNRTKKEGFIIPENLNFTGYMKFDEYYKLIANADCLLALTYEDDCLQSGAYEALSVQVPMVISDSKALRDYFSESAIYTDHNPINIANNIQKAIENCIKFQKNEIEIKNLRNEEFKFQVDKLIQIIKSA
ncbi:MAG: glycosyltransferase [Bacteroidetes bacterium]|nr:glycosyltransferase [Bacteroidota bacterium]